MTSTKLNIAEKLRREFIFTICIIVLNRENDSIREKSNILIIIINKFKNSKIYNKKIKSKYSRKIIIKHVNKYNLY